MSAAEAKLRAGDLSGCLDDLQGDVRRDPGNLRLRVFLAQLLMVTGEWDRAVTQLSLVGEMDASALPMVHTYGSAMQCERLRRSVFRGERSPLVFGDPEPWIAALIEALALLGQGRTEQANSLRQQALEAAPTTAGTVNGTQFDWIADADSRLGPVLELVLNGSYYWLPVHRVRRITIEAPADLRDFVWLPAQFTWENGGEAMGLIPTRYVDSEDAADDALRLARKTEWRPIGEEAFSGIGQRVLATSAVEVPLLEVRELVLEAPGA
jgi:type VI secretion system protein ImpE